MGHAQTIERLLERKETRINVVDRATERKSPLDYAIEQGHEQCVAILVEMNAMISADIFELAAARIQRMWKQRGKKRTRSGGKRSGNNKRRVKRK